MEEIFILDAVNYLFRSYYAIGPMTNDAGESTSALYGFIRSLNKLRKDFSCRYLICVFDGPDNKKSRQAHYAEYKMNRKGAPQDLYPQFECAYHYCELAGIPAIAVPGVEADDTIASIGKWAENEGMKVYLCTSDKDLCQMVSKTTFLLNVHKDNLIMDEKVVEETFGVKPSQMLDYLSIAGDASDNIPGISGFGPKTAVSLLQEFGTLENILAHPEKIQGEKKQKTVIEQKDQALLSKKLASLDLSVSVSHEKKDYLINDPNEKELEEFFHRMKFTSLLKELKESTPATLAEAKKVSPEEKVSYHLIESENSLASLLDKLAKEKEICLDTETTGIHPLTAELVGVGLGVHPKEAYYIPLNGSLPKESILTLLKKFFTSTRHSFYGHNLKYDYLVLSNLGIELSSICFDTILASYLLAPQNRRHNLDELSLANFGKVKISYESLTKIGKKEITMKEVPIEKVSEYCCEDVDYTCRLKGLFEKKIHESSLEKVLKTIEVPLLSVLAKMEKRGIYVDEKKLKELSVEFSKDLEILEAKIFSDCGETFNINSPKQLGNILFEKLKLPLPRKKQAHFSTAADVLENLADDSPVVRLILQYRGLQKLLSTYIDALPSFINPQTQRIHASFNQSVTATGRLSCQDPNLQNIPIRSEDGKRIRKAFKPQKKGWSYLSSDYSQIELRLLAHFSEDPHLVEAFEKKLDIHKATASKVFHVPLEEVTKAQRSAAKAVNFGILYGQGPYGLAKQIKTSPKEAASFIESYFEQYPKILDFIESCKQKALETGFSTTLFGRTRPIPEIHNKNPSVRMNAERLSVNTPLQGSAADLIKISMIAIDKEIEKEKLTGYMILQIHDELLFEVPDDEIFTFRILVQEKMENVVKLKVPLVVDMEVGKNWEEC